MSTPLRVNSRTAKPWKWIKLFCPGCGKEKMPTIGAVDRPDSLIIPYLCWDCEHPEEAAREKIAQEEAERKFKEMCERGEVKDADGNTLEYFVVRT